MFDKIEEKQDPSAQRIDAHVPESEIFPAMIAIENVMVGLHMHERRNVLADMLALPDVYRQSADSRPKAAELLAKVKLADCRDTPASRHGAVGMLSGGQQQMLAIGRALRGGPRVLLWDEPSIGLSPLLIEQIFSVIAAIRKEGVTVLMVEQNAQAALSIADRDYVQEAGAITLEGSGAALLDDERVRDAYLGQRASAA